MTRPRVPGEPGLDQLRLARQRLGPAIHQTPVVTSHSLGGMAGRPLTLKLEMLQRTGAFKARGALNLLRSMSPERLARGVVAASAGNHGQAVAWAAHTVGARATIFVPAMASMAKVAAIRSYGAEVVMQGETFDDALDAALEVTADDGRLFAHPFDDPLVVAGQGTVGLELAEQVADLEVVVVPVGGGGLASGVAVAIQSLRPGVLVYGVQAERCAPLAGRDYSGPTIADGIAVKRPGQLTGSMLEHRLDGCVTVSEDELAEAILLLLERAKLLVEGAGAAPLAAVLAGKVPGTGRAALVLSGGNIDASDLIAVARRGMTRLGRYSVILTTLADRPGELARLITLISSTGANIVGVQHLREGMHRIGLGETDVELTLMTRDHRHLDDLVALLTARGYTLEKLT